MIAVLLVLAVAVLFGAVLAFAGWGETELSCVDRALGYLVTHGRRTPEEATAQMERWKARQDAMLDNIARSEALITRLKADQP